MKNALFSAGGTALLTELDALDAEGKRWLGKWSGGWRGAIEQGRGNQWGDAKSEPMFLANYISSLLLRKQALLTESKPALDVLVRSPGLQATATVLRDTIKALWDELGFQIALEQSATYLEHLGHFYWRITWDPMADYGNGDIALTAVDPRQMRIDPAITHVYDLWRAQYLIEDEIVPLSWIAKNYPKQVGRVSPNANLSLLGADTAERGFYRRWTGKRHAEVKDSAMPRVWIRRYWLADTAMDEDGKPAFPGGRLIIRTGDDVILNPVPETEQQNPYFDGLWPYEMMDSRPDVDHPFGNSSVMDLKRMQEALNRVGHTLVKQLVKNVDYIISDANALTPDTIAALKQLEMVVIEKGAGREVQRIPATSPEAVVIQFMGTLVSSMKEIAGIADDPMGSAKGRVELRSAPQLEGLQSASQTLIRFQARRLEYFFERIGAKLISRIFQFYTTDRILNYAAEDKIKQYQFEKEKLRSEIVAGAILIAKRRFEDLGEDAPDKEKQEAITAEDILLAIKGAWRKFSMKIVPYTSIYQTRQARASMKLQVAEMGYLPASEVLAELGFDNPKELMQEAVKELQERQELGLPPPQSGGNKKKDSGGGGKKQ